MSTFDVGKGVDDIQEPTLLPADWYMLELAEDGEQLANKKMKLSPETEGAGYNIYLIFKTLHDDIPEYNGRTFKMWLPMPTPEDKDNRTSIGQTMEDFKLSRIFGVAEALNGGKIEGTEIRFDKGMRMVGYIKQEVANDGPRKGQMMNRLDDNTGFKNAASMEG